MPVALSPHMAHRLPAPRWPVAFMLGLSVGEESENTHRARQTDGKSSVFSFHEKRQNGYSLQLHWRLIKSSIRVREPAKVCYLPEQLRHSQQSVNEVGLIASKKRAITGDSLLFFCHSLTVISLGQSIIETVVLLMCG